LLLIFCEKSKHKEFPLNLLQALLLGIIQGLTEFLPISSSAHLVIAPFLLGWTIPAEQVLPFDVLVQLGTLAAVIVYFWHDLWAIVRAFVQGIIKLKPFEDPQSRMGWLLILATIPAGLAGLFLKKLVDQAFQSVLVTGVFLVVTALLLLAAERISKHNRELVKMTWVDSLVMGIAQAISIFPGISRSGATMSGGLARNLDRTAAARFSFLMSIPIMLAAAGLEIKDIIQEPGLSALIPAIVVGILAAAVVGYLAIRWLLRFLGMHSLRPFAVYCAAMGILVVVIYVVFPH
jgi:undecaprenyl-diphosphatase